MTKMRLCGLALFVAGVMPAMAQLGLSVALDRTSYVQYEPVFLTVTLRNYAGNTLEFGSLGEGKGDQGWLRVQVINPRGDTLPLLVSEFNPCRTLSLAAGASRAVKFQLNPFFAISSSGTYQLQVRVGHIRLGSDYLSPKVNFRVDSPRIVKDYNRRELVCTVGVPAADPLATIAARTCSLVSFPGQTGEVCALKISDSNFVYSITRLGPMLRGAQPQLEADSRSLVHVFMEVDSRMACHWVYDLSGNLKEKQYFQISPNNLPGLIRDPELGRVMVRGGTPAVEGIDFNEANVPTMGVGGAITVDEPPVPVSEQVQKSTEPVKR